MDRSGPHPTVTVLIATYNRAPYLRTAVESVLAQDFADFKLCILDDASTDGTVTLLESITDPRVTWRRQPVNVGWLENCNAVIALAETDYLILLGDDDIMCRGALRRAIEALERHPSAGMVHAALNVIDADGMVIDRALNWTKDLVADTMESGEAFIDKSMRWPCRVCSSTVMMRRQVLPGVPFQPEDGPAADVGLWLRIAARSDVCFLGSPGVNYRVHNQSDSARWSVPQGSSYAARRNLTLSVRRMRNHFVRWVPAARRLRLRWRAQTEYSAIRSLAGESLRHLHPLPERTPLRAGLPGREDGPVRILLGGAVCDLLQRARFLEIAEDRLLDRTTPPLLIASANLQHIQHFGRSKRSAEAQGASFPARSDDREWLVLLDGAPLVAEVKRRTGRRWPRLAGADLLPKILDVAQEQKATVGMVGGTPEVHAAFRELSAVRWPSVTLGGLWSPLRDDLLDEESNRRLAEKVRAAGVDVLVVALGKPRQELWLDEWGGTTGARVGACFGGAVDLLTGGTIRAPVWLQKAGLEWLWRLAHEPRRLVRRYLVDGPPAYLRLRRVPSQAPEGSQPRS
jgi:exopolysaccharide biosynthesis WecB/TagA/CpsF family protein